MTGFIDFFACLETFLALWLEHMPSVLVFVMDLVPPFFTPECCLFSGKFAAGVELVVKCSE